MVDGEMVCRELHGRVVASYMARVELPASYRVATESFASYMAELSRATWQSCRELHRELHGRVVASYMAELSRATWQRACCRELHGRVVELHGRVVASYMGRA